MAYKVFYKKREENHNIVDIISFFYIIEENLKYADEETADGFIILEDAPTGYSENGIYYAPYYNLKNNSIEYEATPIPPSAEDDIKQRIANVEHAILSVMNTLISK